MVIPSEVSRVHAVVKHVDPGDLAQTQVTESYYEAVPAVGGESNQQYFNDSV